MQNDTCSVDPAVGSPSVVARSCSCFWFDVEKRGTSDHLIIRYHQIVASLQCLINVIKGGGEACNSIFPITFFGWFRVIFNSFCKIAVVLAWFSKYLEAWKHLQARIAWHCSIGHCVFSVIVARLHIRARFFLVEPRPCNKLPYADNSFGTLRKEKAPYAGDCAVTCIGSRFLKGCFLCRQC